MGVFCFWLSGPFSHLLVVSTHSTRWRCLCLAKSEDFSFGIAGWIVVGGFGPHGLSLVENSLYLAL